MKEFKSQRIKSVIKELLKKKKINYEDLAEQMECSVPTIKRILGPEELTLNRLLQLCEIVDIDLADLESMTQENSARIEKFTPDQENFLAHNRPYFAYLLKLFSGKTPKEIAEQNNLTARSTDKYLLGLEKHELIKVSGKQKVKPNFKNQPNLGRGILAKVYFEEFIQSTSNYFIKMIHDTLSASESEKERPQGGYTVYGAKITPATYDTLLAELQKSIQNLAKVAEYEEKTKPESELKSIVMVFGSSMVKNDYPGLKTVDNAAGEIINL